MSIYSISTRKRIISYSQNRKSPNKATQRFCDLLESAVRNNIPFETVHKTVLEVYNQLKERKARGVDKIFIQISQTENTLARQGRDIIHIFNSGVIATYVEYSPLI